MPLQFGSVIDRSIIAMHFVVSSSSKTVWLTSPTFPMSEAAFARHACAVAGCVSGIFYIIYVQALVTDDRVHDMRTYGFCVFPVCVSRSW